MRGARYAVAAAILAAAALLRLWDLAGRPLWLDESWSRWMAGQGWAELWASARLYDAHPPLYYSLLKGWAALAPTTPLGLRSLSVLAGLALLPLAWACARRLDLPRWSAPFAAAAAAAAPALVTGARQARPYALFALAFAAALWAALGLLRAERAAERTRLWIVYLLAIELVLWLHGLGVLFAAALGGGLFVGLALAGRLRRELAAFLGVHALAGLAWLPCLFTILEQRREWTRTWLRFDWAEVPAGLAGGLAAPGVLGLFALALAAAGAAALLKEPRSRPAGLILAAAAFAPAAATILLSAISAPVFLPRTLAPSVLPVLLLAAAGLSRLGDARLRIAMGAAALGLLAASAAVQVARPPEERWDRLAAWLDARVGPADEIWLLPNELALPLGYAGGPVERARGIPAAFPAPGHPGPRHSGTRAVPGIGEGDSERLVADARRRGVEGIWLVSRFGALFDPQARLGRALGDPVAAERAFAPLLIRYYRLEPIPPPG